MSAASGLSDWPRLLRVACALIRQVNAEQTIIDQWTLGGGTAMMLQIDHRDSHDIDVFFSDPQFLSHLDPEKHDFDFEVMPSGYHGDGVSFLKLTFKNIGQIDFIVGQSLTASPAHPSVVAGDTVFLETIPEIITKKVYHRGAMLIPRDIFDIAAAGVQHADAVIAELRNYREEVARTIAALDGSNPNFVNGTISQLTIKEAFRPVAITAHERAREILRAV
ncbi:MAG: hypothetical protein JWR89_4747 [Tardiphaga sp.]|uniref:nucleotidyl transferase AbiEii/AbiGii toxin family protein n=1 Tax=Tardiphaga sp. TaxID=1926292 RepID=UPI00260353BD|nr:nucleotidyl transferase AbiEii/AbiGii toxin family protein [Tardiphaga sp.]MDB5504845.1 hypothetical protein [Tardiphaga sp.]